MPTTVVHHGTSARDGEFVRSLRDIADLAEEAVRLHGRDGRKVAAHISGALARMNAAERGRLDAAMSHVRSLDARARPGRKS